MKSGRTELNRVESYALAVGEDDRLDEQKTEWTGYPIGVGGDRLVSHGWTPQGRSAGVCPAPNPRHR